MTREPIAVIGTGYVGLVTAAGFAQLGSEVWCVDIDAEKIARSSAARSRSTSPASANAWPANRERLHFSTELAPALEHARLLFVAVGTPPTYSGDADLSAVNAVVDAMPRSDRHALVMKSTVPVGTGDAIKRDFAEPARGFAYVSCPEFLKEGSALEDFLHARPSRGWRRGRLGGRRGGRALCAPRRAARPDRHRQRGDDQARGQRVPGDQDLVHQRDRERVRGDRRRRARGRPGHGARSPDRRALPASRGSDTGARCFPKDVSALKQLAGNSGYHFQLLTAVIEVNELQKRRVIAQAAEAPRVARRASRVALLGLAFKANTDDMSEASSLVLSARLLADGAQVRRMTRWPRKRRAR